MTIFYDENKILTTNDDNLPIIEIDENYSYQSINTDLQFLIKVSYHLTIIKKNLNKIMF